MIDATHRVDGVVGHGHEELVTILAEWIGTWDEWREEIEEVRDVGDLVLVISTQRGRGKGSGVEWEGRFGMVYEVRGGKITHWTVFDDPRKALEAVGLSEECATPHRHSIRLRKRPSKPPGCRSSAPRFCFARRLSHKGVKNACARTGGTACLITISLTGSSH